MFYKLPKELEDKILFLSHPILSKSIQNEIKNYKFINL